MNCHSSQKGTLSIDLEFNADIADTQIVYVIGKCHSTFEITADRNIISNYAY